MTTLSSLPPDEPLLLAALRPTPTSNVNTRPSLMIEVYCAWCRAFHAVGWPDQDDVNHLQIVVMLAPPCTTGPFAGKNVALALDPSLAVAHGLAIHGHKQALRRWLAGQRAVVPSDVKAADRPTTAAWGPSTSIPSTVGRTPRRPPRSKALAKPSRRGGVMTLAELDRATALTISRDHGGFMSGSQPGSLTV